MMMKAMQVVRVCVAAIALTCPLGLVAADQLPEPAPDAQLAACMDQAVSTMDMHECNAQAMVAWDAELNVRYGQLMQGQSAKAVRAIRQSQRDWLVYRDSYFKAIEAFYQQEQGTIWGLVAADRKIALVRSRALELSQLAASRKLD